MAPGLVVAEVSASLGALASTKPLSHLNKDSGPSPGKGRVWGGLPPMAGSSSAPTGPAQQLLGHPKSIFRVICGPFAGGSFPEASRLAL